MKKSNQQVLAKLWKPLYGKLSATVERACLRRDAYLDRVFAHEARMLKAEVPRPNSADARRFLESRLQELDRRSVNFSLSSTTVEAVNHACEELNVVRDCFINRVLFLLLADIATCEIITGLEFRECLPDILGEYDRDYLYAPLWSGSLAAISEIVREDPFWALRNMIDYFRQHGDEQTTPLHACVIVPEMFSKRPPGVIALNCYLPDEYVPGSAAQKHAEKELEDLLGEVLNIADMRFGSESRERRKERK